MMHVDVPHILLTNDDGIESEGIALLAKSLAPFAKISIIAPATDRSGTGSSLTLSEPLRITPIPWNEGVSAWKVSGTPADCVRLGLSVVLQRPPDCILSGINRGSNSGRNVLTSGTIGAAIEGAQRGIPSMALSSICFEKPNYALALPFIPLLMRHILQNILPKGTFLNINFPSTGPIQGVKLARQGRGYWKESPETRIHPEGHSYYWLGGSWETHEEHPESDVLLVEKGFVTAVPIHVGEMTDHLFLETHKSHFETLFAPK